MTLPCKPRAGGVPGIQELILGTTRRARGQEQARPRLWRALEGPGGGEVRSSDVFREIARVLGNETNLQILSLLSTKASYPRELASLLMRDETDISRRLKRMEALGIVEGYWSRVGGRNVKLYRLAVDGFHIRFKNGKMEVVLAEPSRFELRLTPRVGPPTYPEPAGRERELSILNSTHKPVVHVWGPPGVGKTHLVAYHLSVSASDRLVYWHYSDPGDTPTLIAWKVGLALSYAGYEGLRRVEGAQASTLRDLLLEGIATTGAYVVFDDFHLLNDESSRLILAVANRLDEGDGRLYIVSRRREHRLPYWKGIVEEVQLQPLTRQGLRALVASHHPRGAQAAEELADSLWKCSKGIPVIVHAVLEAVAERGEEALKEACTYASQAYFQGSIPRLLDSESRGLLEALALVGGWVPLEALCGALSLQEGPCWRRIRTLEHHGYLDSSGATVRIREYLQPLAEALPPARRKSLARRLAGQLYESSRYEDKVRALQLLARECLVEEAAAIVRDRLLRGSSHFLCCRESYIGTLERLLNCPKTATRPRLYILAEYALLKKYHIDGDIAATLKYFERVIPALRRDKPVYTRLLALRATIRVHSGSTEGGYRDFEEALRVYAALAPRERAIIEDTIHSTAALVYFERGEIGKAIEATRKEMEATLAAGDIGNYILAKIHLAEIYRLVGMFQESLRIIQEAEAEASELGSSPIDAEALSALPKAASLLGLGRYREALEEATKGLRGATPGPHKPSLEVIASVANYMLGDTSQARKIIEKLHPSCKGRPVHDCAILTTIKRALECEDPSVDLRKAEVDPGERIILNTILAEAQRRCHRKPRHNSAGAGQ